MHLTAALIPQARFHMGTWLISVENPVWYYFLKRKNPNHIFNATFMDSVDPPLRKLVQFLQDEGIRTTPSCSGHYRSRQEYEKIYTALEKDREIIRHEGLSLKDIETEKLYLYKNKEYHLPWNREIFLDKIMAYQHKGVLGMRLEHRRKIKEQIMRLQYKGIHLQQKDAVLLIEVLENSERENLLAWEKITSAIQNIFDNVHTVRELEKV